MEKICFNPIIFKSYSSTSKGVSNPIDNKPREFNPEFYVDKNGADAIKVRNFVANPTEINKPISYEDYIKQLKNANLVENIDYVLNDDEDGALVRIIRNGNIDKTYKTVFWHGGDGVNNYGGYEDSLYPMKQNQPITHLKYDEEGILEKTTQEYNNPDAHKDLFPENIDINTSSQDYVKLLDSKNIKYEISRNKIEENNAIMTSIHELDNEDREVKSTTFFEYPNGDRTIFQDSNPGINGMPTREVDLIKDGEFYELLVSENEKYKGNIIKNSIKY